jgi:parvulin-like peptidyl-prolyl isomerase
LPRKRRQHKIPTPAWEREHSALGSRLLGRSPQFYAVAGVIALVAVALGIVAYAIVADEIANRNRPGSTAVQVAERQYSLDYFTDRVNSFVQQNGGPGQITAQSATQVIPAVQEQLIEEQVLVRFAGELGLAATDDQINDKIAERMGINKTDPTFATRYQEELSRTGLSELEFKEVAEADVLRPKVLEKFKTELPASAESIHYRQIIVKTQAEADAVRAQLEGGADFAALAKEKSLDTQNKDNGGDAGWVPRGSLDKSVEEHLFAQEVNKITTYPTQNNVYVYQVTEKAADRPLEDAQKTSLSQKKYNDWFTEKRGTLTIKEFDSSNADNVKYLVNRVWPDTAAAPAAG